LVIVVDDGSNDGTVAQLREVNVTVLQNHGNQGKAASLWRGMQHALKQGAEAVVTLDGDGQHEPADIPALIAKAREHSTRLVIAARLLNRENAPKARLFANNFADFWVSWACGQPVYDSQSGFRLYPAQLLRKVEVPHHRSRSFVFESEILIQAARLGFPIASVPIASRYHTSARASHFRPVADITRIVLMISWKLISRGGYLPGLYRYLRKKDKKGGAVNGATRHL
jgi:GT2 family glycosyltransferase